VESTPVDLKTLHRHLGCGRLSFGSTDLLRRTLGVEPGSVTPLAVINDKAGRVRVVLDDALFAFGRLNFHPLVNTATTGLSGPDFLRFLEDSGHAAMILPLGGGGGDDAEPAH
jgi:Ala-tRNA(Pro) deacylase